MSVFNISVTVTFVPARSEGFVNVAKHYVAEVGGAKFEDTSEYSVLCQVIGALKMTRGMDTRHVNTEEAFDKIERVNYDPSELQRIAEHETKKVAAKKAAEARERQEQAVRAKLQQETKGLDVHTSLDTYNTKWAVVIHGVSRYNRHYGRPEKVIADRRFPQKADGSFNWKGIREAAQEVHRHNSTQKAQRSEEETRTERNKQLVAQLRAEFNMDDYGTLEVNQYGNIKLITPLEDEDLLRAVLQALETQGKLVHKGER